ncbi:hypothetical protein OFC18_32025, partial [Escherichia coli]|nr:hypothetical protein [Escherichia coli]
GLASIDGLQLEWKPKVPKPFVRSPWKLVGEVEAEIAAAADTTVEWRTVGCQKQRRPQSASETFEDVV